MRNAVNPVDAMLYVCVVQAAAQASYFLPAYDSRQTANTISALREQVDDAKKQQAGKKRFGFSKRSKRAAAGKAGSSEQVAKERKQLQHPVLPPAQPGTSQAQLRSVSFCPRHCLALT